MDSFSDSSNVFGQPGKISTRQNALITIWWTGATSCTFYFLTHLLIFLTDQSWGILLLTQESANIRARNLTFPLWYRLIFGMNTPNDQTCEACPAWMWRLIRNAPLWCWTTTDDLKSQTSYDAINNATAIWACPLWKRFVYAHGWCWPHCFFMKTLNCIFTTCCGEQTKEPQSHGDAGGMQIIPQRDADVINIHFSSVLLLQMADRAIRNSCISFDSAVSQQHNNRIYRESAGCTPAGVPGRIALIGQ